MRPESLARLDPEAADDLLSRGYSRRALARIALVFGGAALAASAGRPAFASGGVPDPAPAARVRIGANECWTGPMEPGQAAARAVLPFGNRYEPKDERGSFIRAVCEVEGVPESHVAPFPGSSDPLSRAVVTFCSPARGLVTADPTFELAGRTAEWLGAPVRRVPLTSDHRHDLAAMAAADPAAGLIYVCSPNNPTGGITPLAEIERLLAAKPDGTFVLVDEAYIHFSDAPRAARLAAARKDVLVLRTFSKIFGMAGLRMGYVVADPSLLARMMRYDGGMQSGALPLTSLACGRASLRAADLIAARREEMRAARALAVDHTRKRGFQVLPSDANMFMVDWGDAPAAKMREAFRGQSVEIGRSWPIWPHVSRITVGSMDDMTAYCAALDAVLA